MRDRDPDGALARQVLSSDEEARPAEGFSVDPVGDEEAEQGTGILKKYEGRALLLVSSECVIHCRFCFRKAYTGSRPRIDETTRRAAIERLRQMTDVREVILSGGDPLTVSNRTLKALLNEICDMPHIERVRFHTRMVTAAPERVDTALCALLKSVPTPVIIVTHVNHPNELHDDTAEALAALRAQGVLLLNQSVLLKGVNDDGDTLTALSEKLIAQGVLPYYLHQLDKVEGAAHFEVPIDRGRALIEEMRHRCPGYMVPKYVREIPSEPSKTPI